MADDTADADMPELEQVFKTNEAFRELGAEEYKTKGNDAFKGKQWDDAIYNYTRAINIDPSQAVFYSNRAACWSSKGDHASALSDATMCLQTDPDFVKGYSRKGKALFDMKQWDEAESSYRKGLEKDAGNDTCMQGIKDVQQARQRSRPPPGPAAGSSSGVSSFFGRIQDKFPKLVALQSSGKLTMILFVGMALFWLYSSTDPKTIRKLKARATAFFKNTTFNESAFDNEPVVIEKPTYRRGFVDADGSWVSYMEGRGTGDCCSNVLLFLHRTTRSAEGEYGGILPEIQAKGEASPVMGGIHLLAPDLPCHGYSPCIAKGGLKGRARDVAWINGFVSSRTSISSPIVIAVGREAVGLALSMCKLSYSRRDPVKMVLISPRVEAKRAPSSASSGPKYTEWLKKRSEDMTIRDVADTALWTALASPDDDFSGKGFGAVRLPQGSTVTLFYLRDDREIVDVSDDLGLDAQGTTVKARWSKSETLTAEALADELWELMGSGQAAEAEEEEEEVDDSL